MNTFARSENDIDPPDREDVPGPSDAEIEANAAGYTARIMREPFVCPNVWRHQRIEWELGYERAGEDEFDNIAETQPEIILPRAA